MNRPLEGIRVVDLSRVLAGPYCTMLLGDLGADVIKVESVDTGDDTRAWGPPFAAEHTSAYYLSVNRNKRSLGVNLKGPEGVSIVQDIAKQSDVVIENFRPGKAAELGLGYEILSELNPGLVYCSISGFGQTGPYRDLPGYDFVVQAMSGLMSITGLPDGDPMKVGVAVADVFTGLYAAVGILAALRSRDSTGLGQYIDLALMDSQVSALVNVASNFLIGGTIPKRYGNQHPNIVPYQTFAAKDGQIAVAVGNDRQFGRLCEVMNAAHLSTNPLYATNPMRVANQATLLPLLEAYFQTRTCEAWMLALAEYEIPCGPIQTIDQMVDNPQVKAREMVQTVEVPHVGDVRIVGNPLKFSKTQVDVRRHPPGIGEHTSEILSELGLDEHTVAHLRNKGAIR